MKKLISILLVIAMIGTFFVGCTKKEDASDNNDPPSTDNSGQDNNDTGDTDEPDVEEETADIVVGLMCLAPMDTNQTDAVEAAINEMTEEKINVHVDLQWYDAYTYGTQIPMMIQANEKLDLMMYTPVPSASYSSFMMQGQLMDITDVLNEYGSDMIANMGDYIKATTNAGKIYGVPHLGPFASTETISMRKDVLEELGLVEQAENMTTWSEYEDILKQVVANTDLAGVINADAEGTCISPSPFFNGSENLAEGYAYDTLGDSYYMVGVDADTDTVYSTYLSDELYQTYKRAKQYYDEGLIYKDAATAQDYAVTLLKNEVGFSMINGIEVGGYSSVKERSGFDFVFKPLTTSIITTGSLTKWGFCVPVTATEPEAAVKFLDLLHSDSDMANTLTWGVEGVDWVVNDDGMADFPEGVTAETVNYHTGDFLYGNRFVITPWAGEAKDIRDQQKASNEQSEISKYLGFSIDSSPVDTEVTACFNVIKQYKPSLAAGSVNDFEATYAEFKDKLIAAGMEKVIAEYQSQLDAWLAEK